jgi:hypothetical protein
MKTSDVLWIAANEILAKDRKEATDSDAIKMEFSCDAVRYATNTTFGDTFAAIRFLRELGVDCGSLGEFREFKPGAEQQGARYLWLMFAHLVAKEEESK